MSCSTYCYSCAWVEVLMKHTCGSICEQKRENNKSNFYFTIFGGNRLKGLTFNKFNGILLLFKLRKFSIESELRIILDLDFWKFFMRFDLDLNLIEVKLTWSWNRFWNFNLIWSWVVGVGRLNGTLKIYHIYRYTSTCILAKRLD